MTKSLGEGPSSPGLGCSCIVAHKGRNQQVTHESPPHNSQLVTLKLRDPLTLAWQEFERGYEQETEEMKKRQQVLVWNIQQEQETSEALTPGL